MNRLMISTFAVFLVIAAATTMLRSHAYTSGHPVASAGMMPLADLHDAALAFFGIGFLGMALAALLTGTLASAGAFGAETAALSL